MPKELILILRSPSVLATVPALRYQCSYRPYRLTAGCGCLKNVRTPVLTSQFSSFAIFACVWSGCFSKRLTNVLSLSLSSACIVPWVAAWVVPWVAAWVVPWVVAWVVPWLIGPAVAVAASERGITVVKTSLMRITCAGYSISS